MYEYTLFTFSKNGGKVMKIRKMLFCIVIPALASFLAGAWFTLHGVSNVGITVLLAIVALCVGWSYYVRGSSLAYYVVGWLAEIFTGFLYIKVLAGLLGEFGALMYILVLILFVTMVVLSIKYATIIKRVARIRKRVIKSEDSDDAPENQPVEQVEAEEVQQESQQNAGEK